MKAGAGSLSPAAAQAECAGAQQRAAQGQQGQGVVGRHGGQVVELMEVLHGQAREIANRLGEVGVVLLVSVGRSSGRHGTDIVDTRAITGSVESPQDKDAPMAHLGELVLGCANARGLKEVESSGFPGHDVPGVAGVRELRNGEAAVIEPD